MSRRSTPQKETDDRAFPVRLFILVPLPGFGLLLGHDPDSIYGWLDREVGRGNYAMHGGGRALVDGPSIRDQMGFYFRHPEAASRFLAAFPTLEIADGTMSSTYSSPALPFGRKQIL